MPLFRQPLTLRNYCIKTVISLAVKGTVYNVLLPASLATDLIGYAYSQQLRGIVSTLELCSLVKIFGRTLTTMTVECKLSQIV